MPHMHTRTWKSWLASSAAVVVVFLFGLNDPVQAGLIVSDLGGQIRLYDDVGNPIKTVTGGSEGIACLLIGGVPDLFVANNLSLISIYNPADLTFRGSFSILGGSKVAALSLSPDGLRLYAADYGIGKIFALDTTNTTGTVTPLFSATTTASHDVVVDSGGSVYAADFQPGFDIGVVKFSANLTAPSTFISKSLADSLGLTGPAGMVFDSFGNLWESNFSSTAGAIFEFDSSGGFIRKIAAPNGSDPFGLARGPDGNIYVALFGSDSIGKIDVTGGTYALSTFISDAGDRPKYLDFTENCITAVPEPGTLLLFMTGLSAFGIVARTARRR